MIVCNIKHILQWKTEIFFFKYDVLRRDRNIIIHSKTGSIVEYLDVAFTSLLNLPSPNTVNTATDKINNYVKNQNYDVNRVLFVITAQLPKRRSSSSLRQGTMDMEVTADLKVKDTEKGKDCFLVTNNLTQTRFQKNPLSL